MTRGVDIGDQRSAGLGAVTAPQFAAVSAIVGGKEKRFADDDWLGTSPRRRQASRRIDILDQCCTALRSIRDPKFPSVRAVVRCKEELAVDFDQRRISPFLKGMAARVNVLHQGRICRGSLAAPQLSAMNPVVGDEIKRVSRAFHFVENQLWESIAGFVDVHDQVRSRCSPVAAPQFLAVSPVVGTEKEYSVHDSQVSVVHSNKGVTIGIDVLNQQSTVRRSVAFP